jgi:hypothetical protein
MKYCVSILVVLVGLLFNGCLSDNVELPEIKARPTFPPGTVFYRAFENRDLQVRWTRSPSDTQLNFRGYYVELYTSQKLKSIGIGDVDSPKVLIAADSVFRDPVTRFLDTFCYFHNIDTGRYAVKVYGVRYAPEAHQDSLVLSETPTIFGFDADPVAVLAPTQLLASSGGGATNINLKWARSASEKNLGFAGYIVRYIDTIRQSGAQLIELMRVTLDKSLDTGSLAEPMHRQGVAVPANPQTLTFREYPYKFWVKAVRKDSVESTDSISIVWSGAERTAQFSVRLDTGMFVGQVNTTFAIAQTAVDNPSAEFTLHFDGSDLIVRSLGSGTLFSTRVDSVGLEQVHYNAPFDVSDFSVSSLTLPKPGFSGSTFYALLPGGNRARIFVARDLSSGTYVNTATSTVSLVASFQPAFTKWPFF